MEKKNPYKPQTNQQKKSLSILVPNLFKLASENTIFVIFSLLNLPYFYKPSLEENKWYLQKECASMRKVTWWASSWKTMKLFIS